MAKIWFYQFLTSQLLMDVVFQQLIPATTQIGDLDPPKKRKRNHCLNVVWTINA